MNKTKFINRKHELKLLNNAWGKKQGQLIVVWGRRRVGKTTLILEFAKDKKTIYFMGRLESGKEQLNRVSHILSDFFKDNTLNLSPLQSWDAVFEYIVGRKEKIVLVFDEFPYMIKTNPAILSVLQDYWDRKLKYKNICIILCGSVLSMMEKFIFDYKMPIYGRRTLDLKINPLSFRDCIEFFPGKKIQEVIEIYSVFGGTPSYLFEYEKNIEYSIEKIISKQNFLAREPIFLLNEELSEPRFFMSILHAISIGKTTTGEIISLTGLQKGIVGKYISILIDLNIIRREISITESWKSRKGLYFINDNFFNFWFRFIFSNLEFIETNSIELLPIIKKEFNSYVGFAFEQIAKEFIISTKEFNFTPLEKNANFRSIMGFTKIGRWWHKDKEIDFVALNENTKEILFCEVKYRNKKTDVEVLSDLREKAKYVKWNNENRKEYFACFSKSGFTKIAKQYAKENKFLLFSLEDIKEFYG